MEAVAAPKDFDKFYDEELVPAMQGLDAQRLRSNKYWNTAIYFCGGVVLSVLLLIITGGNKIFVVTTFACVAGVAVFGILYNNVGGNYRRMFKTAIISRIIKYIDPAFQYAPSQYINEEAYMASGLYFERCSEYTGEDYVEGRYGGTTFCFSELHAEKRVGNGRRSYYETIFKGIFFMTSVKTNFQGHTYVWSAFDSQSAYFSRFSPFGQKVEKVTLESPEFERRFTVYSNDQVGSRYILTPTMMERLIRLQDFFEANAAFSFINSDVYVAIPKNVDIFEPPVSSPADKEKMKQYFNTVHAMLLIIEELKFR